MFLLVPRTARVPFVDPNVEFRILPNCHFGVIPVFPYHHQRMHVGMAVLGLTGESAERTGSGVSDQDGIG